MIRVARAHLVFMVLCGIIAGLAFGVLMTRPQQGTIELKACATEDSTNCYWDSGAHGNGQGIPFISVKGETYYPELGQLPTLRSK